MVQCNNGGKSLHEVKEQGYRSNGMKETEVKMMVMNNYLPIYFKYLLKWIHSQEKCQNKNDTRDI